MRGHWRAEHLFELAQAVELYMTYQQKIADCDRRIEALLKTFENRSEGPLAPKSDNKSKRSQPNAPSFDARSQVHRMTGVDLTSINGIEAHTALKVISEIGLDMTRWPTVKHFTSWLGLCPGSKITGGKAKSSRTKPSANRAAAALRLAANSLHRSDSALGAFSRRMKAKIGAPAAITATAHKLARLVYSMLKHGTDYVDAGQDYYERQYRHRVMKNLTQRAKQLGYKLVELQPDSPSDPPKPTITIDAVT